MFKNYLHIALRNLWKSKSHSAINLVGLALGIACSLLILLWVQDERSVDAFHKNSDRLFYVYEKNYIAGKLQTWYWTQGPLAEELKKEIPEVEGATAISWAGKEVFRVGDKVLKENGYSAGADFFTMFSHQLLEGSAKNALSTPNSLAISRKMAKDFFGSPADAIGKTILFDNKKNFTVSAVFEDMTRVADRTDFIMSWSAYVENDNGWAKEWPSVDPRTVILLRPGANAAAAEQKMAHMLDKFGTEQKDIKTVLALQPFKDYYLRSEFKDGVPTTGKIEYVRLFGIVALFILLIACINFMNLTTARSVKRAKEIGVRKVMGAVRGLLIRQFIGEAILMAFFSVLLALLIVTTTLPAFNQLTDKQISLPVGDGSFWASIVGITLLTGLLSGSYPAFFLSSFSPIRVLKAALPSGTRGDARFRQGLVVFQFVLSIVLILSTMLVSRQVNYLQTAKLGYDRENLLYIPLEGELAKKLDVFAAEVKRLPGVQQLSFVSSGNPTYMNDGTLSLGWTGKDPSEHIRFIHEMIGPDFMKTMKLQMVAGRDFQQDFATDTLGCILNETAVALMGYQKDPIGKIVEQGSWKTHIIGVVKDFHFQSLHEKIMPLILNMSKRNFSTAIVRTQPGQTTAALGGLEKLCRGMNPAYPFSYRFSDQDYARMYDGEQVIGRLSVIFAGLAISISCLGLLGLSMFTAEQRTREIGIRKVLGAGIPSLFALLSRNFLGLVGLAFLIAAPLGWWAMNNWLQGYAYRTDIPWWMFFAAGTLAVAIALVTVFWQTIRAARANPVRSLRAE
ncbi:MAG: ABC transporter permease [Bacteroidetes bacterium]|nr:ABC transporter permease [Bacteroidota bacterium]